MGTHLFDCFHNCAGPDKRTQTFLKQGPELRAYDRPDFYFFDLNRLPCLIDGCLNILSYREECVPCLLETIKKLERKARTVPSGLMGLGEKIESV